MNLQDETPLELTRDKITKDGMQHKRLLPEGCRPTNTFQRSGRKSWSQMYRTQWTLMEDEELKAAAAKVQNSPHFLRKEEELMMKCDATCGIYVVYYEPPTPIEMGSHTDNRRKRMKRSISKYEEFQTRVVFTLMKASMGRAFVALNFVLRQLDFYLVREGHEQSDLRANLGKCIVQLERELYPRETGG